MQRMGGNRVPIVCNCTVGIKRTAMLSVGFISQRRLSHIHGRCSSSLSPRESDVDLSVQNRHALQPSRVQAGSIAPANHEKVIATYMYQVLSRCMLFLKSLHVHDCMCACPSAPLLFIAFWENNLDVFCS